MVESHRKKRTERKEKKLLEEGKKDRNWLND